LCRRPARAVAVLWFVVSNTSTTGIRLWGRALGSHSLFLGAGYLALYLLLDWASYVEPLRNTSITPWNPNTGVVMALLLARGGRWAPLVAFGIFVGELLTDEAPAPWGVLALASLYLAAVYACAAWGLRRRGLERSIATPKHAAWFAGVIALASGVAAAGYVGILVNAGQLHAVEAWASFGRYWIGEFNGIIALTPVLLLKVDRSALWEGFRRNRRELILQAVGAVLGVGLAFALAAVLSPTDAVALSGIAGKGRIPANLMHILEGEALMNDASGLVALKFAIAAALTGVFSLRAAAISFVLIAVGGILIGAAISWLVTSIPGRIVKLSEDDDPAGDAGDVGRILERRQGRAFAKVGEDIAVDESR